MQVQVKLLRSIVVAIAGQGAEGIVDLLYGKKNVNEFLIANKLGMNINQARNILYKLSDEGLVSFVRKKDKKNGGWYTYFWTLDVGKSLQSLKTTLEKDIKALEEQHDSRKVKRFYYCKECDLEMNEENALLNNFTCPECGEVLELRENEAIVNELDKRLGVLRESLESVVSELDTINKKEEHLRKRRIRAEEKRKAEERARRRREREKLRAKEKGVSVKKAKKVKKVKGKPKAKKKVSKVKGGRAKKKSLGTRKGKKRDFKKSGSRARSPAKKLKPKNVRKNSPKKSSVKGKVVKRAFKRKRR